MENVVVIQLLCVNFNEHFKRYLNVHTLFKQRIIFKFFLFHQLNCSNKAIRAEDNGKRKLLGITLLPTENYRRLHVASRYNSGLVTS